MSFLVWIFWISAQIPYKWSLPRRMLLYFWCVKSLSCFSDWELSIKQNVIFSHFFLFSAINVSMATKSLSGRTPDLVLQLLHQGLFFPRLVLHTNKSSIILKPWILSNNCEVHQHSVNEALLHVLKAFEPFYNFLCTNSPWSHHVSTNYLRTWTGKNAYSTRKWSVGSVIHIY